MDSPQGETKPLFDEDLFNDNVLRQIKELQDTESGRFSVLCDELVFRDIPLLLKIIIEACLGSHAISEEECGSHLTRNMQLGVELIQAYKDKSFVDVLYSDNMPSEIVQFAEDNPRGGLQVSSSHETLKSAFETPYIGDTHELLIKMLNQELKARRESAAERPYNLSVAVIQSSGMGKSRMLEEVGNEVFALITNIREDLPTHKTTYPPVDLPLRTYFEGLRGKSDYEQQADCAVLQRVQCDKLVKLTERHFRGQTGKQLAGNFAKHMKEESTEKALRSFLVLGDH
ncbi:hypothetical protein FRC08_014486 [Ceratobasidium sp. 394]|nr:hypothetical protein FRC08_014486 [Ceratobasidium sp. 394]